MEPNIPICVYLTKERMHCIWTNPGKDDEEFDRKIEPGDFCLDPDAYAKAKKHHEELHKELEGRNEARK